MNARPPAPPSLAMLLALLVGACGPADHLVGESPQLTDDGVPDDPTPVPVDDRTAGPDGECADALCVEAFPAFQVRLPAREVARRLSTAMWNEPLPGLPLIERVESKVKSNLDVRELARDMLSDPRARAAVMAFARWWFDLDRISELTFDGKSFPLFSPQVAASMERDALLFVEQAVFASKRSLNFLLTAPLGFVNQDLAPIYGVPAGPELTLTKLPHRAGLFSLAGVLAMTSHDLSHSAVLRGAKLARDLICTDVPAPPSGVAVPPIQPPGDDARTSRQRLESHREQPQCASCHRLFDPLGFAYESFDAIGRHRDEEFGFPIDDSWELIGDGEFESRGDGPAELGARLAETPLVARCLVRKLVSWTLADGRGPEAALPAEIADRLEDSMRLMDRLQSPARDELLEILAAATATPAFLHPVAP